MLRAARALKPSLLAAAPPPKPPDPITKRLKQASRRYTNLLTVWAVDLRVDVTTLHCGQAFDAWRDLRHVLVHRLGAWQPGLSDQKPSTVARVRAIASNPDVYRGVVPLSYQDVTDTIDTVVEFLSEVDRRAP